MSSETEPLSPLPRQFLNRWKDRATQAGYVSTPAGSLNRPKRGEQRKKETSSPTGEKFSTNQPTKIGGIFDRLLTERGWEEPVAVGSVLTRWPDLVGPELSQHCTAESFTDTTLIIRAETTDWATQLKLMQFQLLQHLANKLGEGVVTELKILSPYQNRWTKGPQWVRGRGPRDTFG